MKTLMSWWQWKRSARACLAALVVLGLAGCDRGDIQVYKVAKETPAGRPPVAATALTSAPAQPQLKWILPAGWTEVAPGEMRLASFRAKGAKGGEADVSVISLAGRAGGDLSNVNRWRGQVGLPPVDEDALAGFGEQVTVGGSEATLFDLAGVAASGDKTRILAAVLHQENAAWFFKMTGDDELVAGQKVTFVQFLKTLTLGAADSASSMPPNLPAMGGATGELPANHPAIGAAMPALSVPEETSSKPQWEKPASWTEAAPTQMLLAKFSAGDLGARAEITVSAFPGDVGGLLANVNRWRRQMSLPDLGAAQMAGEVKSLDVAADKGTLVEMAGVDAKSKQPATLLGVVVPHGGQTWFFKMTGDAKAVAAEKETFIKFVQTTKLPNAL